MKNVNKGFTLIELLVVLAIGAILLLIAIGFISGGDNGNSPISYGINGLVETRCINGMSFTVGESGFAQQIVDSNGNGIQCGYSQSPKIIENDYGVTFNE